MCSYVTYMQVQSCVVMPRTCKFLHLHTLLGSMHTCTLRVVCIRRTDVSLYIYTRTYIPRIALKLWQSTIRRVYVSCMVVKLAHIHVHASICIRTRHTHKLPCVAYMLGCIPCAFPNAKSIIHINCRCVAYM
jgi:hypothetical protein